MQTWTIGKRVVVVSTLLMALILVAGAAGLIGMSTMKSVTFGIKGGSIAAMERLSAAESLIFELRGHIFLAALSHQSPELRKETLARADAITSQVFDILNHYDTTGLSAEQVTSFDALKSQATAYVSLLSDFRRLEEEGKLQDGMARVAVECIPKRIGLQKAFTKVHDLDRERFLRSVASIDSTASSYSLITLACFGFSLVAGTLLIVIVLRSINASLKESASAVRSSAGEVTAASAQVASASESLAQGASEQAASLEETSASGQEISAMTQRNAENSRTAAAVMVEVDRNVVLANQKLEQLIVSMGEISTSSERIAKIIKVIDDIAFQTNILALNAAVEAARAGEAGLGFAVVADEVRNLAQRCAQAAKDTTNLIEESVVNARNGGARLDEVADVIRGITQSAARVKTLVDQVSQGGHEQARGIDQISRALVQMEQTTQQSAASAEESASASQQLKAQAGSLEQIVIALENLYQRSSANVRAQRPTRTLAPLPRAVSKATSASSKPELVALDRVLGKRNTVANAVTSPALTAPSAHAHAFPLDESEFTEF